MSVFKINVLKKNRSLVDIHKHGALQNPSDNIISDNFLVHKKKCIGNSQKCISVKLQYATVLNKRHTNQLPTLFVICFAIWNHGDDCCEGLSGTAS